MIDVLKEIGNTCRKKKIGESMMDSYQNLFKLIYKKYPIKANEYLKEFLLWKDFVSKMDCRLEQLHILIRKGVYHG